MHKYTTTTTTTTTTTKKKKNVDIYVYYFSSFIMACMICNFHVWHDSSFEFGSVYHAHGRLCTHWGPILEEIPFWSVPIKAVVRSQKKNGVVLYEQSLTPEGS